MSALYYTATIVEFLTEILKIVWTNIAHMKILWEEHSNHMLLHPFEVYYLK